MKHVEHRSIEHDNREPNEIELEEMKSDLTHHMQKALDRSPQDITTMRSEIDRISREMKNLERQVFLIEAIDMKDLTLLNLSDVEVGRVNSLRDSRSRAVKEINAKNKEAALQTRMAIVSAFFGIVVGASALVWNIINALYAPKAPSLAAAPGDPEDVIRRRIKEWRDLSDQAFWAFVSAHVERRTLSLQGQLIVCLLLRQPAIARPTDLQWAPGAIREAMDALHAAFRASTTVPRSAGLYTAVSGMTGRFIAPGDSAPIVAAIPRPLAADLIAHVLAELLDSDEPLFT
jgi:hypothetical protein